MEEKNVIKVSVSSLLLFIAVVIIVIMGIFIFKLNKENDIETQKANELKTQVGILNNTVDNLQGKLNTISETVNSTTTTKPTDLNDSTYDNNTSKTDDIKYEISTKNNEYGDEIYAIIKATKDGKTVTKEIDMGAMICDTDTMILPTIGSVAVVTDSAGEYLGVTIFKLINNEIIDIGGIDCGIDMVSEATYEVTTKGVKTVVISAKRDSENIKQEFKMDDTIIQTDIVDFFNYGKVVLVTEKAKNGYLVKAFRLTQDYTNGKTIDIKEVGKIEYLF